MNKKAITPVVAISLILTIAIISVINFQIFTQNYTTKILSEVESKNQNNFETGIKTIINNKLYFKSSKKETYTNIKIGNHYCNISGELKTGINEINLEDCSKSELGNTNIILLTNNQIYSKYYNFKKFKSNEYLTKLSTKLNTATPTINQDIIFYANYSSKEIPFSGIGLKNYEIGQIIWNYNISGNWGNLVTLFDNEGDGLKNDIASAGPNIKIFNNNGTIKYEYSNTDCYYNYRINTLSSFNPNNKGIENLIISGTMEGPLILENKSSKLCLDITTNSGITKSISGDFDGDGNKDDIIITNSSHILGYFYNDTNWNLNWTNTANINYEIVTTDINDDGKEDIFGLNEKTGLYGFYGNNGSLIWNIDVGTNQYSVSVGDLNNDGKKHEFVITENQNLFWINSTGNIYQSSNTPTGSTLFETEILDLDTDGYKDDIILADSYTSKHLYIRAYNNTADEIWSYDYQTQNYNYILSIYIEDINNDKNKEIIFSESEKNNLIILNKNGTKYSEFTNIPGEDIGLKEAGKTGNSITSGDINNDGINDLIVGSAGYLNILQDVNCKASFSDSTNYNMIWNNSILLWQINKTFTSPNTYTYNITCIKNGYQTQTKNNQIIIN